MPVVSLLHALAGVLVLIIALATGPALSLGTVLAGLLVVSAVARFTRARGA